MIAASSSRRKVVDAHRHSLRELKSISNSAARVAIFRPTTNLRYSAQDFFSPTTAPRQFLISHPPAAPSEAASRSFLITIFYINFISLLLDALSTLVYNVISGLLMPTRPSRLTLDPSRFKSGVSGQEPLRRVSAQILTFTHPGSQTSMNA